MPAPAPPLYERIFHLVASGDLDQVVKTIDTNEATLNVTDSNQSTPLTRAFAYGHLDIALMLIERGANLFAMNHSDKWGMRYIMEKDGISNEDRRRFVGAAITRLPDVPRVFHAVWQQDSDLAKEVLRHEPAKMSVRLADPDGPNGFYNTQPYCGLTPLHYAVIAGDEQTVSVLLQAGAEVDAVPHAHRAHSRHTPMYFVPEGCGQIARLLIEHGADASHSTLYLTEGSHSMREVVIEHGAGGTPLLRALILKDFHRAAEIIRDDPTSIHDRLPNANVDTPLHMAVQTDIVSLLLDQGMDVDTPSAKGYTALAMAPGMYCSFEMIRLLVENGADVRAGNDSPLYGAVWQHAYGHWDYEDVIRYLANKGSKPRGLVDCVRGGNLKFTELMLELGADPNETDELGFYSNTGPNTGHTALDYCTGTAGVHTRPEIAELLRKHGGKTKAELV